MSKATRLPDDAREKIAERRVELERLAATDRPFSDTAAALLELADEGGD